MTNRPMIEMTLPSTLDHTVAPPGAHVAQMFVQFTPYFLAAGKSGMNIPNKHMRM